jgi:hypothetical protein
MNKFEIGEKVMVVGSVDFNGVIAVVKGHIVLTSGSIIYNIQPLDDDNRMLRRMPEQYLVNYMMWKRNQILGEIIGEDDNDV